MPRVPGTWHTNEHSVPPTCSEVRHQLVPELAFSRKFAGAYAAQVLSLCASVTNVYLIFFVIGKVLTRLDWQVEKADSLQSQISWCLMADQTCSEGYTAHFCYYFCIFITGEFLRIWGVFRSNCWRIFVRPKSAAEQQYAVLPYWGRGIPNSRRWSREFPRFPWIPIRSREFPESGLGWKTGRTAKNWSPSHGE